MGILDSYRVVDLSVAMAGPLAAMRLGDLGADVVKVEPIRGEWQRHTSAGGATGNRVNASFLSLNRNKRSIAVDLKAPEGQALRAGTRRHRRRLPAELPPRRSRAPRRRLQEPARGQAGPCLRLDVRLRRDRPLLRLARPGPPRPGDERGTVQRGRPPDAPPAAAPFFLADAVTAYSAFEGVLAALLHRERTGEGQLIEVNMLDSIIAFQMQELSVYTVGGVVQNRSDEVHAHTYIRAPYGIFPTSDGYLTLAFADLDVLSTVLGVPELAGLDAEAVGFTRRDEVSGLVSAALATRTSADWLETMRPHGIWCGPVYDYSDVVDDPQVQHNGSFVTYEHPTEGTVTTPGFPYRFSRTPAAVSRPAPLAGEHTAEVLRELGIDGERYDRLIGGGVIASDDAVPVPAVR